MSTDALDTDFTEPATQAADDGLNINLRQIFRALDFIRDNAPVYAKAKAEMAYLEQFRKTKKALCMREAELKGVKTLAAQERDAYADPEYIELLVAYKVAVEEAERLRWLMVAAQIKVEFARTMEATRRAEARNV